MHTFLYFLNLHYCEDKFLCYLSAMFCGKKLINLIIFSLLIFFNTNSFSNDKEKFGQYEVLDFQGVFKDKTNNRDIYKVAATEIQYRFLNKKSSLDKYPGKAIEGIIWFEIFYNEGIKNEKAIMEQDIIDLLEIRNNIRKSFGFSENISTREAIDRYYLLSRVLSYGKTEQIYKYSKFTKERKKIFEEFKSKFNVMKTVYVRDAEIVYKITDNNAPDNIENISSESTNTETTEIKSNKEIEQKEEVLIVSKENDLNKNVIASDDKVTDLVNSDNEKLMKLDMLLEDELITNEEYIDLKNAIIFGNLNKRLDEIELLFNEELLSKAEYLSKRKTIHEDFLYGINLIEIQLSKILDLLNNQLMSSDEFSKYKKNIINNYISNINNNEETLFEIKKLLSINLINNNDYITIKQFVVENLMQSKKDTKQRLLEIKNYLEKNLFDLEDYNSVREKILDEL